MYYKVTNLEENHNGYQYKDGLNILDKPFEENGSCVSGGLYFTDIDNLHKFLNYGCFIRKVILPDSAKLVKDPQMDKYRADQIILEKKYDLRDFNCILENFPNLLNFSESIISILGINIKYNKKEDIDLFIDYFKDSNWYTLIDNNILCYIVNHNRLDLIREYIKKFKYDTSIMDSAAKIGHLEIVQYLHEIGKDCTTDAMNFAARYGHLEVVKYLHEIGKNCTTYAMNSAAENGHLDVVKYLHEIGKNCTIWAMNWAAENGHLEVVKYLHEIGKDCTTNAMNYAARNRHLEIVKFLEMNLKK